VTYRPDREKAGFCEVVYRDGSARRLPRNEFEQVTAAMQSEKRWYEATGLYGQTIILRLADVLDAVDFSADAVQQMDAEADEEREHKRTHGGDDD